MAPVLSANHDEGTTAVQILYDSSLVKNPRGRPRKDSIAADGS